MSKGVSKISLYIGSILMAILLIAIIAVFIVLKKMEQPKILDESIRKKTKEKEEKKKTKNRTGVPEDLLGFQKIDQGIIYLENGHSLRAIIGVDSIHYYLLSEEEQEAVDGALASVLASISYPVQPLSITKPVDLYSYIESLKSDISKAPATMQQYGEQHIAFLEEETKQQILIKQDYLVVGVDNVEPEDLQQAKSELDRRCGLIISGLRRAELVAHVLDTYEVMGIFYDIFHANRVMSARLNEKDELETYFVKSEKPIKPMNPQPISQASKPNGASIEKQGLILLR
jgi:hypothetical protein